MRLYLKLIGIVLAGFALSDPGRRSVCAQQPNAIPVVDKDLYGDSLPPGALARLGTVRWRHDRSVTCVVATADGRTVATGGWPTVCLWDAASGRRRQTLHAGKGAHVNAAMLAFDAEGKSLAAVCGDRTLRVWDVAKGVEKLSVDLKVKERALPVLEPVYFVGFAAGGQGILVKDWPYQTVRLIDASSGKDVRAFAGHRNLIVTVALSRDGRTLATAKDMRGSCFRRMAGRW